VTAQEVEPIKRRLMTGFPDAMRKSGSAAGTIRSALQNGQPFDAPDRYLTLVSSQKAEDIGRLITAKLPESLTTIVVTPSAEGLGADCVIRSLDELPRCLAP
jgi:predicted Zn-dependent peptidase